MRIFRLLLCALILLGSASPSSAAASQAGTSGAQFLKLGAGARAGGMADAFTAISDDAYASYYNPAGLTQVNGTQLAGAHTSFFQGVSYEAISFAYPLAMSRHPDYSGDVFSLGVYQLSVADIPRYTSDSSEAVGSFGGSDGAYSFSYAHGFNKQVSAGITAKYISEDLDTFHTGAYSFDGGVMYHMNPEGARPFTMAATVRNMGSRVGYVAGNSDPLPTSFAFAAAMQVVPKVLTVDAEVTRYRDTNAFASFGAEFNHKLNDSMGASFRAGYTSERTSNPGFNGMALGAGLGFKKAAFDFAWQPFGTLGDTFRYSLIVKF